MLKNYKIGYLRLQNFDFESNYKVENLFLKKKLFWISGQSFILSSLNHQSEIQILD